jgi:hypothetical protein
MNIYWTILEKRQKELVPTNTDSCMDYIDFFQPTEIYFTSEESALEMVEEWLKTEQSSLPSAEYTIKKVYTNILYL